MTTSYFKIRKCLFSRGAETSPSIGADLVDFPQKGGRHKKEDRCKICSIFKNLREGLGF